MLLLTELGHGFGLMSKLIGFFHMKFSIQDISDLDRVFTGHAGTCMLSACYSLHCPGPGSYEILVSITNYFAIK